MPVASAAIFQIVVAGVIGAIVLKMGFGDPADEEVEPRPGLTKPRPERIVQFPEDQSVGERDGDKILPAGHDDRAAADEHQRE